MNRKSLFWSFILIMTLVLAGCGDRQRETKQGGQQIRDKLTILLIQTITRRRLLPMQTQIRAQVKTMQLMHRPLLRIPMVPMSSKVHGETLHYLVHHKKL
ncbi:hypothetical protein [Paenibacillus sp. DCT19]|uniref:hypothetical protein n=1 Tax=Paenibacillus sp. DCT19 TaxID=2211212 RepID=UPI0013E2DD3B|nr:hypothetical protein [Paenibacillus sp. DCT19]